MSLTFLSSDQPSPDSPTPETRCALVVIGASAGGVEALSELVRGLPHDFPASVFVVLHVPRHGTSVLPAILSRRGNLPARVPVDGEKIQKSVIYVAPPDNHMVLENGHVRLTRGPTENGHRPAIDPLFRSAAKMARGRVIGVVLSGMLDDGTAGLLVIKREGGTAVIQEPSDALFSGMPSSAQMNVAIDYAVAIKEMGALLTRLVELPGPENGSEENNKSGGAQAAGTKDAPLMEETTPDIPIPSETSTATEEMALYEEVNAALMEPDSLDRENQPGAAPSVYSCPECKGVLWEVKNEGIIRFRCRTGHAYSGDSLLAAQSDALEAALWTAFRALEESGSLSRRLHARAKERGHHLAEVRFAEQARECDERAAIIRNVLVNGQAHPTESAQAAVNE